jgi:cell division septal protein FtsQ
MAEHTDEMRQMNESRWGILGVFLFLLAGIGFCNSRFFILAGVTVKGNRYVPEAVIIHGSGINRAQNIFRVKSRLVRENILKNPYIAAVAVRKVYPDRILITVTERTPLFLLLRGRERIVVGNDWKAIAINPAEAWEGLPVVVGLELTGARAGPGPAKHEIVMIREIFKASDRTLRSMLRKIDLSRNRLFLELPGTSGWVSVELGNTGRISEKISNLRAILARNRRSDLVGVDLRVPGISTITTSQNKIP